MRLTVIILISIIGFGCNTSQKPINPINLLSPQSDQKSLSVGNIYNLDSINGFRGIKLNTQLTEYSLADWVCDSSADGYYKCFYKLVNGNNLNFSSSKIKSINLYFLKNALAGLKIEFDTAESLYSNLQLAYGQPTWLHSSINMKNELDTYYFNMKKARYFMSNPDIEMLYDLPKDNEIRTAFEFKVDELEYGGGLAGLSKVLGGQKIYALSLEEKRLILSDVAKIHINRDFAASQNVDAEWVTSKIECRYNSEYQIAIPTLGKAANSYDYLLDIKDSVSENTPHDNYAQIKEKLVYVTYFYKPLTTFSFWNANFDNARKNASDSHKKELDSARNQNVLKSL